MFGILIATLTVGVLRPKRLMKHGRFFCSTPGLARGGSEQDWCFHGLSRVVGAPLPAVTPRISTGAPFASNRGRQIS